MDIRKWLDETVQPELLTEGREHPIVESSRRPQQHEPALRRGKRQRRRTKSDSSLLDPPPQREKPPVKDRKRSIERGTGDRTNSEPPQTTRSDSSKSGTPSQRYARKPRHKTRPDRYEPSSKATKERGRHAQRVREGESKKLRRKSKRKKGEVPNSGIAQTFHAKNVFGDRLTLKPWEQLGIFNKGRTSTAVRGRGLPDLVFSEMKFLQRHKDQPEPTNPSGVPKKKHKRGHADSKEGEISAFFTSVRPALVEKDPNTVINKKREKHRIVPVSARRERERSSIADAAISIVEVLDKTSHLGFGSQGPRHKSTSYVSWSDSCRAVSTTTAHARMKLATRQEQQDPDSYKEDPPATNGNKPLFKRPTRPTVIRQKSEASTEQFRVSSIAPSQHRMSRSHSYPYTSSPRRMNLVDGSAKLQSTDDARSPSSMPPIVSVRAYATTEPVGVTGSCQDAGSRATSRSGRRSRSTGKQPGFIEKDHGHDVDQHTSSDLGRVLQQCNDTFRKTRVAATQRRRRTREGEAACLANETRQQTQAQTYPLSRRIPTVRFAGVESEVTTLPNFAGPSIYEQQAERQPHFSQPIVEEDNLDNAYHIGREYLDGNDGVYYGNEDWEKLLMEPPASRRLEEEIPSHGADEEYENELDGVLRLTSENDVVASGFWRPNKLY